MARRALRPRVGNAPRRRARQGKNLGGRDPTPSLERFSGTVPVMGLRHRYFVYERGGQQLAAGKAELRASVVNGAGVGTAVAAAQLAPRMLRDRSGGDASTTATSNRLCARPPLPGCAAPGAVWPWAR